MIAWLKVLLKVEGRSRKGIMDGLKKFVEVDNHEAVNAGGLRQGTKSVKVVKPQFTAGAMESGRCTKRRRTFSKTESHGTGSKNCAQREEPMEQAHRVLRIRRDGRRSDAVQSRSWPVRPSDRYLEREARRALQGECMAQRRPSKAEVEMDRKSWREEILI